MVGVGANLRLRATVLTLLLTACAIEPPIPPELRDCQPPDTPPPPPLETGRHTRAQLLAHDTAERQARRATEVALSECADRLTQLNALLGGRN